MSPSRSRIHVSVKAAALGVAAGLAASAGAAPASGETCGAAGAECEQTALLQAQLQGKQRSGGMRPGIEAPEDPPHSYARACGRFAPFVSEWQAKEVAKAHLKPPPQGFCPGTKVQCESNAAGMLENGFPYRQYTNFWTLPQPQDFALLQEMQANLTNVELPDGLLKELTGDWLRFGKGPASEVAYMMWQATRVGGVSEHLPKELQGVFWMKGNSVPEELLAIQYGYWYEQDGLLTIPWAPMMWSWPAGKPCKPPSHLYTHDETAGLAAMQAEMIGQSAVTTKFSTCKDGADYTHLGLACDKLDCHDKLAYGYQQVHQLGNLTEPVDIGHLLGLIYDNPEVARDSGAFTMQKSKYHPDGTVWRRVSQFGKSETCATHESLSYDLVKIIDGDGKLVQPWWDEFMEYMGSTPLMSWTGWKSEVARQSHIAALRGAQEAIQAGVYERLLPVLEC